MFPTAALQLTRLKTAQLIIVVALQGAINGSIIKKKPNSIDNFSVTFP